VEGVVLPADESDGLADGAQFSDLRAATAACRQERLRQGGVGVFGPGEAQQAQDVGGLRSATEFLQGCRDTPSRDLATCLRGRGRSHAGGARPGRQHADKARHRGRTGAGPPGCPPRDSVGTETDTHDHGTRADVVDHGVQLSNDSLHVAGAVLHRDDALALREAEEAACGRAGRARAMHQDHRHDGSLPKGVGVGFRGRLGCDMCTEEGAVGRWWTSWTRSQDEVEAVELTTESREHGADPIATCARGQAASIHGTIRSVAVRSLATSPSLEAEVYDGSGHITLVWIGHRRLAGVDAGRAISAEGRVTCPQGHPTIYNPSYRLYPVPGEASP
jgi:hypothetical protein